MEHYVYIFKLFMFVFLVKFWFDFFWLNLFVVIYVSLIKDELPNFLLSCTILKEHGKCGIVYFYHVQCKINVQCQKQFTKNMVHCNIVYLYNAHYAINVQCTLQKEDLAKMANRLTCIILLYAGTPCFYRYTCNALITR